MTRSKRILLVEDDADVRDFLEGLLRSFFYDVDSAATWREAQDLVARGTYDLALADAWLPDGDGIEIARRATERGAKAIILTGYALALPVEVRISPDLLEKPVRPVKLLEAVVDRIGVARAQERPLVQPEPPPTLQ